MGVRFATAAVPNIGINSIALSNEGDIKKSILMGKLYSLISVLFLTVSATFAAVPDSYEWWFDNDVSSVQTCSFSGNTVDFQIDTSGLSKGMHSFSLRLSKEDSIHGSVYRRIFVIPEEKAPMSYEYWFDKDFSSRTAGNLTVDSNQFDLDLSSIPQGIHYFNCHVGYGDGTWGAVFRKMFLSLERSTQNVAYEFWFDDDYVNKSSGILSNGVNSYEIDFDRSRKGLHRFNYRVMNNDGIWGAPYSTYFFCPSSESSIYEYEYWIDDDYDDRKQHTAACNPETLDIDLSDYELKNGMHWFCLRVRDERGEWGSVYRERLDLNSEKTTGKILGYRHYANGVDLGYVDLPAPTEDAISFDAMLPDRSQLVDKTESEENVNATDSIHYVVQLKSDLGWMPPVSWNLYLERLVSGIVRFSYDGHYLTMETSDDSAEIIYVISDSEAGEDSLYSEAVDVKGLTKVKAWSRKQGYLDSEKSEYDVRYYSDEEHAETSTGGLLESSFAWSGSDLPHRVKSFRVEGILNDADYRFLNSMKGLRHLDIEKVADAHIPDNAFLNSRLISVSLPEDIAQYGEGIFSDAECLSSVRWNSKTQNMESRLTDCLGNPNVLVYVPTGTTVGHTKDLNIVTAGRSASVTLHYGYPYYAAWDLQADLVSMTHDFRQETAIDVCRGWETLVLPFSPKVITHETLGEAVPFAAWDGQNDPYSDAKPFWLYRSTATGWEEAAEIEAGVPYIISMPNNPDYVYTYNLAGRITFSAKVVGLGPDSSLALSTPWREGTEFEGTFMPVDEEGILTLNVADNSGDYLPGSTFVAEAAAIPFTAYVRGASGRKAMPVFGDTSSLDLPTVYGGDLLIETPAPGMIRICSGRDRKVDVITATGVILRTLHLKAGEPETLEGLTRDLYIVGGVKVMVR